MEQILIVGQDAAVSMQIASMLGKKLAVRARFARSLEETQSLLEEGFEHFPLAITDYRLPDASDGEIVKFLQSQRIPPVVLATAADGDIREQLQSKNIPDCVVIRKPEDLGQLVEVVQKQLENRRIKALVVDASPAYRESMANIMKSQRMTVFEAKDGDEAIRILKENPDIKVVITDNVLPELDGYDFLTNIRKHFDKDRLAVLVASGNPGSNAVPTGLLKAGANDYLPKSSNREEFLCRVTMNLEYLQIIETLREFGNRDPLTGLYNRRYLYDAGTVQFATAMRNRSNLAVYMMDIDRFKDINDAYGHAAGDQVIRALSSLLAERFRRQSDIVARIGGEEFCVMAPFEHVGALLPYAERVLEDVSRLRVVEDGREINFTVSIGVNAKRAKSLEEMLKMADEALYQAKNAGRNQACMA